MSDCVSEHYKAYNEGRLSRDLNESRESNPYDYPELKNEWDKGWLSRDNEIEDQETIKTGDELTNSYLG